MSISDVGDVSDLYTGSEDRFSLNNMPFSGWLSVQLTTSFLCPQSYQLRMIADKGSIAESLTAARVNVFDRVELRQSLFMKTLRYVALFAIAFFTFIPAAIVGSYYHGYKTIKHLLSALVDKKGTSLNWEKVHKHRNRMLHDLLVCGLPLSFLLTSLGFGSLFGVTFSIAYFPTLYATFSCVFQLLPWAIGGENTYFPTHSEAYALCKSFILYKQFGLVGPNGNLLTWDKDKDEDFMRDPVFSDLDLTGYFGNLYKEKGKELSDAVQQLQGQLPEDFKGFSDGWDVKKMVNYLRINQFRTKLSFPEVREWKQRLLSLNEQVELIKRIVRNALKLASPSIDLSA